MKSENACIYCHSRSDWEEVFKGMPESDNSWRATCYVYGHPVWRNCRGCARCEKDPAKAIKTPPARPIAGAFGRTAKNNVYNHDCALFNLRFTTMQALGDWFVGFSFGMKSDDMRGWGFQPCVYDKPHATERDGIEDAIDEIIKYIKGHPKEAQAVEALRKIKADGRQLTLF